MSSCRFGSGRRCFILHKRCALRERYGVSLFMLLFSLARIPILLKDHSRQPTHQPPCPPSRRLVSGPQQPLPPSMDPPSPTHSTSTVGIARFPTHGPVRQWFVSMLEPRGSDKPASSSSTAIFSLCAAIAVFRRQGRDCHRVSPFYIRVTSLHDCLVSQSVSLTELLPRSLRPYTLRSRLYSRTHAVHCMSGPR